MPGRKNPETTEEEKERDHRMMQKRGYGERVAGDQAEFLDHLGPAAEVAHERARWEKEREMKRMGPDASRPDDATDTGGTRNEAG